MLNALYLEMVRYDAGNPHRIQHFTKVHNYARQIGLAEGLDASTQETLEAAAILHDIGIKNALEKYGSADGPLQEKEGPPEAEILLRRVHAPDALISRACLLVSRHHTLQPIEGIDHQILLEADFLVNLHEGGSSPEAIRSTEEKVFRTQTGREILRLMFTP